MRKVNRKVKRSNPGMGAFKFCLFLLEHLKPTEVWKKKRWHNLFCNSGKLAQMYLLCLMEWLSEWHTCELMSFIDVCTYFNSQMISNWGSTHAFLCVYAHITVKAGAWTTDPTVLPYFAVWEIEPNAFGFRCIVFKCAQEVLLYMVQD